MNQINSRSGLNRHDVVRRSRELRARGFTWDQIAAVWEADRPESGPRVAFRLAHGLSLQGAADRWNALAAGEPTMTKSRIYELEQWPRRGRRPSLANLRMLAQMYQTTARRLLSDAEFALYPDYREELDSIDYRHLDENFISVTAQDAVPGRRLPETPETALGIMDFSYGHDISQVGHRNTLHTAAIQSFRAADRQIGGGFLYATVIRYMQTAVGPSLFVPAPGSNHDQGTFIAAAALLEMAGWMAHDAGHDDTARHHFSRALDFAQVGGDCQVSAHILGSMSHLALHRRRATEAIQLAVQGRETLSGGPRRPELEARLLAMHARGLATLRRPKDCLRLLLEAEQMLHTPETEEPSPWVSRFDEASLASEAIRCLRQLGDLREARRQAERIIALRPNGRTRSRAFGQINLAAVLVSLGETEEACAVAHDALASTRHLSSYLVTHQLLDLKPLFEAHRSCDPVLEFLDCLDEDLKDRLWRYRWLTDNPRSTAG